MDAKKVYFRLTGLRAFLFQVIFTVNGIYFVIEAGMNPLQLVLIGTVMELSVLLFEVPTGVIADHMSRKWSVVIGMVVLGCAHMLEGAVPVFLSIAVAYAIWGLGYTFISGAEEAWIADEVQGANLESLFFRGSQIASLGQFAGIIVSVVIASLFSIQIAIVAAGVSFLIIAIWLAFRMPEQHFVKMERTEKSQLRQLRSIVQKGYKTVTGNTVLFSMAAISLMWGLASEGFDRLWEVHFLQDIHLPESSTIIWFGVINAVALLLNIVLIQWIKSKVETSGEHRYVWLLLVVNTILVISALVFAISGQLWLALASYWACYTLRGLNSPLYRIWLNQKLESRGCATMLSMFGQLDAFGQIAGGPLVGWIALTFSVQAGLFATGLLMIPVLFFLWVAKSNIHLGQVVKVPIKEKVVKSQ